MNDYITPPKLVSHLIEERYGISISNARNMVSGLWDIPIEQRDFLASYYILRYKTEYFLTDKTDYGTIKVRRKVFHILHHRCTPPMLLDYEYVWLSCRVWQPELEQANVVLVKPVNQQGIELERYTNDHSN